MFCVRSSSMQVLWNGSPSKKFFPTRGIRQGDPISPYLFVLCVERLAQAIILSSRVCHWEPIQINQSCPPLTPLFFVDDLLLFSQANRKFIHYINFVLDEFCKASGQVVSKKKSSIFFSKNVTLREGQMLSAAIGIARTEDLGCYLGVSLIHSRVTNKTYQVLVDRVMSRLCSWHAKSLSFAGQLTLLRSVLVAIPQYTMQSTKIPKASLENIEKLSRNFLWVVRLMRRNST